VPIHVVLPARSLHGIQTTTALLSDAAHVSPFFSLPTWKWHIVRAIPAVNTTTIHHPRYSPSRLPRDICHSFPAVFKESLLHPTVDERSSTYRCAKVFSSLLLCNVDALTQYGP